MVLRMKRSASNEGSRLRGSTLSEPCAMQLVKLLASNLYMSDVSFINVSDGYCFITFDQNASSQSWATPRLWKVRDGEHWGDCRKHVSEMLGDKRAFFPMAFPKLHRPWGLGEDGPADATVSRGDGFLPLGDNADLCAPAFTRHPSGIRGGDCRGDCLGDLVGCPDLSYGS